MSKIKVVKSTGTKKVCWLSGYAKVNDPKFSDRYAWANSVDPDQTAPLGAV